MASHGLLNYCVDRVGSRDLAGGAVLSLSLIAHRGQEVARLTSLSCQAVSHDQPLGLQAASDTNSQVLPTSLQGQ